MVVMNTYICKDNRVRVRVVDDNGDSHVLSYPRILMEEKLGRPLKPYEDVHHIDGNPLNNSLHNLEIVCHGEHQRNHSRKYYDKIMVCPICNKEFMWTAVQQRRFYSNLSRKEPKNKSRCTVPFCSKRCIGLYGKQEQIRRNSNAECVLNGET